MRKRLLSFFILFIVPAAALAEETVPPMGSPRRILWAMKCAGGMPPLLAASLAVICVLAIVAVLYNQKAGEGDEE